VGHAGPVIVFDVKLVVAIVSVAIFSLHVSGASNSPWILVRNPHFEVYSHAGERNGQTTLLWLERLRAFFIQAGIPKAGGDLDSRGRVRAIGFASPDEYKPFRTQPGADAYFLSTEARDYLVLPELGSQEFGVAAHEYAHLVLRSLGVRFPPWLAEGIAEFFSTVRIREHECLIGGDLPMRTLTLKQSAWIPLPELFSAESPMRADRNLTSVFYAESWALTDMLIFSPAYAPRFSDLLAGTAVEIPDAGTMRRIYGKSLNGILADLHAWVQTRRFGVPLPGIPSVNRDVQISVLTDFEANSLLADLLLASGKLDEAQAAYRALAAEHPDAANVHAALGKIALRKGQPGLARQEWSRAMRLGIRDAKLCYEYAILAEDAGVAAEEIRQALLRAIALEPEFDDARYKLGLIDSNSGHYQAALEQFRSMRSVPPARAYGYWTALATALMEADRRQEAKAAAIKALQYATSADERAAASRLAYFAETDLTVQLSRDANGNLQMVTARKPHGSDNWNPFIEPEDRIRRLEGQIRKVECSSGKITGFRVESASAAVEVTVPDPTHVLIRGGSPEFVCGAEDGRKVAIEYAAFEKRAAADGVLRGMQFQ
jgi:tetratricopeptide (TPR) repeat protein